MINWAPAFIAYPPGDEYLEVVVYPDRSGQWYFAVQDFMSGEVLVCSKLIETSEQAQELASKWLEVRASTRQLQRDVQGQ